MVFPTSDIRLSTGTVYGSMDNSDIRWGFHHRPVDNLWTNPRNSPKYQMNKQVNDTFSPVSNARRIVDNYLSPAGLTARHVES